jgi:hypothetical protein
MASLEAVAQPQIDAACEVWWAKGGIRNPFGTVSLAQEAMVGAISSDASAVEVYLVDRLSDRPGGGITLNCGTSGAFVILEIDKARNNRYLLAHELGHVLGLRHPKQPAPPAGAACQSYREGSSCSVMTPDSPNSSRNTLNNLGVVEVPGNPLPLGPVLTTLSQLGGWNPDAEQGFFHIVRDFPLDDGTESSVPRPPASDWWTYSDVWNSSKLPDQFDPLRYDDNSPMFAPDHSPIHTQPRRTSLNHMYVRLRTCEILAQPVNVHLYLAIPGDPTAPLTPLNNNIPIVFSNANGTLPSPGAPITQQVAWSVPVGYPAHCCVFAVATSINEPAPPLVTQIIANPTAHRVGDLFSLLKSDNDVAQRNMNLQPALPFNGSLWASLAWIAVANSSEQPARVSLDIDSRQAMGLVKLQLEMEGQDTREVPVGGQVSLLDTLDWQPNERRVVRLRVLLGDGLPEDTRIPMSLGMKVNSVLVGGYTQMVIVKPVSDAVENALDTLYGSLIDVSAGCESPRAASLADHVRDLLENGLRPNWRLELEALAEQFALLAVDLEADGRLECQTVRHQLSLLSSFLHASDPEPVLAAGVRDIADRIQEPAGRLARLPQRRP